MLKKLDNKFLFILLFVVFRCGILITTLSFINSDDYVNENFLDFPHYKIFLVAVFLFLFDYIITIVKNIIDILSDKNKKQIKIFSILYFIISLIIILSFIETSNPKEYITAAAVIILLLVFKYSVKPQIRYYL
ncbi:MAG TPA: hypothetical protein PLM75_05875 [bacterium]|mgnify:CR=1 FL=1|nr:hypothetical protein [bacterium]